MRPPECRHPANGLLPWFVNGNLHGTELEWVSDHVASCDLCAFECEALAEAPVDIVTQVPAPPRKSGHLPYALVGLISIPVVLGIYCLWPHGQTVFGSDIEQLSASAYLDLGAGPKRASEQLKEAKLQQGVGSVVVSFLVPLSDRAVYTFDLQGPHGMTLARNKPLGRIDEMGRCTYALPARLMRTPGEYAIVLRVTEPSGESRLYPYPFLVSAL